MAAQLPIRFRSTETLVMEARGLLASYATANGRNLAPLRWRQMVIWYSQSRSIQDSAVKVHP